LKSFIRWAGSKRLILKKLTPYCPKTFSRYIEPFAGSACLFFDLEPNQAILGDLNSELIRTFRAIRRDVDLVLQCLRNLPTGKEAYYRIRSISPTPLPDAQIAARFIYLNRYCFNGLYRTNLNGFFNVPYGPPKSLAPISEHGIRQAAQLLQNATLLHADFAKTISQAKPGDFVYLDPPYAIENRRMFSEYLPGSFNRDDLTRLELTLETLDRRGINFLISYADSPEARKLLRKWSPRRIWAQRNISGFAAHRRGVFELIATNVPKGEHVNGN
jgi:DNA adenine methylase